MTEEDLLELVEILLEHKYIPEIYFNKWITFNVGAVQIRYQLNTFSIYDNAILIAYTNERLVWITPANLIRRILRTFGMESNV